MLELLAQTATLCWPQVDEDFFGTGQFGGVGLFGLFLFPVNSLSSYALRSRGLRGTSGKQGWHDYRDSQGGIEQPMLIYC